MEVAVELEVRMFGPVAVDVGGRCLGPRDFGGRRQKQTLEILLVHQGEAVPKDRMADLLWGERLPKDPFRTLESYVSTLRSHLAPEAERARRLVVTETNAYRFPLRGADVDLWRFDALVTDAGAAPPGKRHDLLAEAADLARGDVMADEPYAEWVLALRDLYRERYVQVVVDAAEDLLTAGDPRRALAHAADALGRDPTRERAHRVVMAAHALLGEQALALRAYDDCRAALEAELGAVPSAQTEQLYVQLINGEVPAPHERAATTIQLGRSPHPVTRYARSGDDHVAFQVVGDGPVDVVYARSILDMAFGGDVRHQLPHVAAPTLVLQRSGSVWVSPDNGRYVAEHIPGARYVELPGADEWPWLGDTESVLGPTEAFLDDLSG